MFGTMIHRENLKTVVDYNVMTFDHRILELVILRPKFAFPYLNLTLDPSKRKIQRDIGNILKKLVISKKTWIPENDSSKNY